MIQLERKKWNGPEMVWNGMIYYGIEWNGIAASK